MIDIPTSRYVGIFHRSIRLKMKSRFMKNWNFCIGDVKINLSTTEEGIHLDIPRFQCMDEIKTQEQDVWINLYSVEDIDIPEGVKCISPKEHPVWMNGTKVSRLSWDNFQRKPHMRIDYDLLEPNTLKCSIRSEHLSWAIREKYLWTGVALQYILIHHQHLIFHASYIKVQGRGIIFIAPSGTGKSTQAALWEQYRGAEIINGDKACIHVSDKPTVHGVPFDGTSGICHDISCQLAGIVLLEQAKDNTIERLRTALAIHALFSNVFVDRSIPYEWNKALELIMKLIDCVPIYHLKCTPDERAVETLERVLEK